MAWSLRERYTSIIRISMRIFLVVGCLLLVAGSAGAQQFMAWDPSRHTPNARTLGLGRAFVGLADDTAAIYTNPAGLAEHDNWEFSSMSGRFVDEFSYYSATG